MPKILAMPMAVKLIDKPELVLLIKPVHQRVKRVLQLTTCRSEGLHLSPQEAASVEQFLEWLEWKDRPSIDWLFPCHSTFRHTIGHIVDVLDTHSTEYKRHAIPTAYPAAAVVQSHPKPIPIHPFVHLQRQLDVLINRNLSDIS